MIFLSKAFNPQLSRSLVNIPYFHSRKYFRANHRIRCLTLIPLPKTHVSPTNIFRRLNHSYTINSVIQKVHPYILIFQMQLAHLSTNPSKFSGLEIKSLPGVHILSYFQQKSFDSPKIIFFTIKHSLVPSKSFSIPTFCNELLISNQSGIKSFNLILFKESHRLILVPCHSPFQPKFKHTFFCMCMHQNNLLKYIQTTNAFTLVPNFILHKNQAHQMFKAIPNIHTILISISILSLMPIISVSNSKLNSRQSLGQKSIHSLQFPKSC